MTFTGSSPAKNVSPEGETLVTKSKFTRFLNYLFCRGDLAKQKLTAQPVPLKLLFRYSTRADHILLIVGVIAASLSGMTQPFLAILAGRFFNTLLGTPPESDQFLYEATLYTSLYLGSFFVCVGINLVQFLCFQRVCARQIARIRHEFVRSILRQDAGWFDSTSCGTLTTQLNDNIERIRDGIGDKLGLLIRGFVMFVASLGVSLFFEWRVALFMAPVAPLTCGCMNLMNRKIAKATSKELSNIGNAGSVAEEAVLGVRTVQSLNGQEEMVSRYEDELSKGMEYAASKALWSGFLGGVFFFFLFFFMAGGMLLGGHLLKEGIIKHGGDVMTAVLSMLISAYFLGMISPQLVVILNSRVAAAVIYKTIERVPSIDVYEECGQDLPEVVGEVEFRDVRFRYPSRKDVTVLDGFCLKVATGKTLALVGHSGSGKSTAIGLLSRLYEVEAGHVLIDGVDVREIRLSCLRRIIGVVEQQPALFSDTIKENIRLGREDISDEDMKRVCRMANAHEFITKLPKGYDTVIGDGGVQLSGGQKQRVAIARTLARDPKILLLDEATSALDGHSETVVQQALENAMKGRTTIVIAHRLATVVKADLIVVMEKGEIVETGVHKDLMAAGGKYAALAKAQLMNKVEPPRPRTISTTELSGPGAFRRGVSAESSIRGSFMSTGDIECFSDDKALEGETVDKNAPGIIDLYKEAGAFRTPLIGAFSAAALRGLEMPINTICWGILLAAFKDVGSPEMMSKVRLAVFLMLGNGVFMCVTQTIGTTLFGKVAEKLILSLRVRAFRNVLHQDAAFFDLPEHSPGKIITRLATDGPNTKAVVDSRMFHVTYYCSAWAISIGVATYNCWPLGLVGFLLSVFLFWFLTRLARRIQKRNLYMSKHNPAGKLSVEIIENVRTIQLLTREERFYEKYRESSHALKHTEVKNGFLDGINFGVSQSYIFFSIGVAYGLCAYFIRRGYFPIVDAYQGVLASFLASICTMLASAFYSEFSRAQTAIGLMFKMIRRESATGDIDEGDKPILNGDIEFDEVHFIYPQRPLHPVMKGLSLSVKRGQTIALVGPSGSGKSTIISMLERFYDTTMGSVKFDGHELKKLSLRHLRTRMALVGQEPRLFSGSIKQNICFGMGEVEESRIKKSLDMANASSFIFSLPQGLDTEVGEKGAQLSGGQKQRVAIARALIREPVVLLLDEATSALDSQAEKAVQEALEVARQGRTVVAVAHRLSSIQNADEILFVSDGKVRERGTHQDLMRQRGLYYELVLKQDLERNREDD